MNEEERKKQYDTTNDGTLPVLRTGTLKAS